MPAMARAVPKGDMLMTDYRSMYDAQFIGAWDLSGHDVTVKIAKVSGESIVGEGGRTNKRPILTFAGAEKRMIINRTNGKIIASLYGNDVAQWVGKAITLYPTRVRMGPETVDAVRVRPEVPKTKANATAPSAKAETLPHDPETGEVADREPGADG